MFFVLLWIFILRFDLFQLDLIYSNLILFIPILSCLLQFANFTWYVEAPNLSICVHSCQFRSILANFCHLLSIPVHSSWFLLIAFILLDSCQFLLFHDNHCWFLSIFVNSEQFLSILVDSYNSCQFLSIRVNSCRISQFLSFPVYSCLFMFYSNFSKHIVPFRRDFA